MSAGIPNWQKLYEMGKLPKSARANVPMLAQLDASEKKIEEIKKDVCDNCREKLFGSDPVTTTTGTSGVVVKCDVPGCGYVGEGRTEGIARNVLRMHGKTHEVKKFPDNACSEHPDGCPEGSHK